MPASARTRTQKSSRRESLCNQSGRFPVRNNSTPPRNHLVSASLKNKKAASRDAAFSQSNAIIYLPTLPLGDPTPVQKSHPAANPGQYPAYGPQTPCCTSKRFAVPIC
jgi:hypothetical protein